MSKTPSSTISGVTVNGNHVSPSSKRSDKEEGGSNSILPNSPSSCQLNSLSSDAEEHFEFSPDFSDDPSPGSEDGNNALDVSKLSSDSFRSTSSASSSLTMGIRDYGSPDQNGNGSSSNNNPFGRNNHLRQSFNHHNRANSWSRNNFRRSSSHSGQGMDALKRQACNNETNISQERVCLHSDAEDEDAHLLFRTQIASLETQISSLNQSQTTNDERYSKVKQENASLLSK